MEKKNAVYTITEDQSPEEARREHVMLVVRNLAAGAAAVLFLASFALADIHKLLRAAAYFLGAGVKYLSQDGVIKLACLAGIEFQTDVPSERLKVVQNLLDEGSEVAATVFSDVGVYLAYSLLYYYDFYKFENVLLMGRVMSGLGGEIIMNKANEVLKDYGADKKFRIMLPDENFRRLGQSVAASYLG